MKRLVQLCAGAAVVWASGNLVFAADTNRRPSAVLNSAPATTAKPAAVEVVYVASTNWVKRVITNVVDVFMPTNLFVDEYHTNWIPRVITNFVDVHKTNWFTTTLTNHKTVDLVTTNWTAAFRTNHQNVSSTNWETVIQFNTNWVARTLTNYKTMDLIATNWVTAYRTNSQTLTLTNWETVLQFKTNTVKEQIVRVVEVDAPPTRVAESQPVTSAPKTETAAASSTKDSLVMEATKTGPASSGNEVGVLLKVGLTGDPGASLQVEEWRVDLEGAPAFFVVKDRDFKRAIPVGTYRVQVKARRDANSALLLSRGRLEVTRNAIVLHKLTLPLASAQ